MNFYEWFFLEKDRSPEGLFSLPHLLSVTLTLGAFLAIAIWLGKKFRDNPKGQFITMLVCSLGLFITFVIKIGLLYY